MNKWRRYRRLSAPERASLLRALALLPLTGAALALIGLRRWKGLLAYFIPSNGSSPVYLSPELIPKRIESARRTAQIVAAASREGIYHGQCLPQSLVLWWLLLRQRQPAELHIGVRQSGANLEAHAWVELFGSVVNDSDGVRQDFVAFDRDIASIGIEQR